MVSQRFFLTLLFSFTLALLQGCQHHDPPRVHHQLFELEGQISKIQTSQAITEIEIIRSQGPSTVVELDIYYRGRHVPQGIARIEGSTLVLDVLCHPALPTCEQKVRLLWPI